MENYNSDNENERNIRKKNDELRQQIQNEFGGKSWVNPDSDLPPELENEFLNHILAFEKAFENRIITTVYEFLGKPNYRKIEELSEAEIPAELARLYEIMHQNEMKLSTLCEVSDRELYRFITEELFFEEKDNIRIPGMTSHFTYEEFHPNHDYDIRQHIDMFTSSYFDKDNDFYLNMLTSESKKATWHQNFRNTFSFFEVVKLEVIDVDFSLETEMATADFNCEILATVENSSKKFRFFGVGTVGLKMEYDYWCVDSFELPKPE